MELETVQCVNVRRGVRCTTMIQVAKGVFSVPHCLDHSQFRTYPEWKSFYQLMKRESKLSNSR